MYNVRSEKKYTKRSSNTLLRLVYFFSEQTLLCLVGFLMVEIWYKNHGYFKLILE